MNLRLDETSSIGELWVRGVKAQTEYTSFRNGIPRKPHHLIIFRVLLTLASFICCSIAIGWFRQTCETRRTGKARPLTLPLPAFLELDIVNEFAYRMTERSRDRRPPWLQAAMDRVRVASTILNN